MTTTTDTTILAQGGFNTGRLYTQHGQRIFWQQFSDGWLGFYDVDRMVEGWVQRLNLTPAELAPPVVPGWLVGRYDAGAFQYYPPREHRHARFEAQAAINGCDFGPALRI